ncbi:anti-sigma-I factor RsgI6-like [Mercenaria mercenaria]|uniref:anti-sigma-I factor RsgI6-like n=1 Tax=Mercenaria mercenaria TaxID=6596 RepID=UPI00234EAC7A|nr:anti-sigma-I factor RsgI6-like [Mercenaria mercenaria]
MLQKLEMFSVFFWVFFSCYLVLVDQTLASVEVLKNPDMEIVNFDNNWSCKGGCTLTSSKDHYSGSRSVMVSNRTANFNGLAQNVVVTPGSSYNFTAYIQLLNMEQGAMYQTVETKMTCKGSPGKKQKHSFEIWTRQRQIHVMYIYKFGATVNYLVDDASLQVVEENANWKTEANARIEKIRKSDIDVVLSSASQNEKYQVELIQNTHEFAFGSAVGAKQIVDPNYRKYAQALYDNFEWAVLENALKWRLMEWTKGKIDYDTPINALNALKGNGLEHWDVNNENTHGVYFETATGNPNITNQMFDDAHAVDPNVKIFLNDFGVMEQFASVPLHNQAKFLKQAGVPIYGVGIQSHIKNTSLDIAQMKGRLDMVAAAGLPIWITELSLASNDTNSRASALRDILTLYFSHPAVEGVLFWGFWDGKIFTPEVALFEGPDVTPNEAGKAYQTLFKTTWRTSVTRDVTGDSTFTVRGFKGEYTVKLSHNGKELKQETFKLGSTNQTINIDVGKTYMKLQL